MNVICINNAVLGHLSLILVNEFEKISFQVSTFANGLLKENFFGIDFRQNLQNSQPTHYVNPT